jgi:hypothetical protein
VPVVLSLLLATLVSAESTSVKPEPTSVESIAATREDSLSVREAMRAIALRLAIGADDFEGLRYYAPAARRFGVHSLVPGMVYAPDPGTPDFLASAVYLGDDWIFMYRVVVLVGDHRLEHEWKGSDTNRDVLDQSVYESQSFTPDSEFIAAISGAPADVTIKVRLGGTDGNCDFVMDKQARQAWKDMVYYYQHFGLRDTAVERTRIDK